MGKILEIFLKFVKIFLKNRTTAYKAGLSKLDDLYNLVTKIITKYPTFLKKNWRCSFTIFENFISF